MRRFSVTAVLVVGTVLLPARADDGADLRELKRVYATQPQGYPAGKGDAQPDTSAPFRWHGYHNDAVRRHEDAKMDAHVEPYNPLEDVG